MIAQASLVSIFSAGNFLPIERCAIRFTMKPAIGRPVGANTDGEKMVENLHRQRVLNFLDMFSTGDLEGALSRCTDDIEFFSNAPVDILPHMGHRHGKAELREMWEIVHTRYSGMRYEIPILIAEGDQVAANIRAFFRAATTASCSSTSRRSIPFAMAASRGFAKSWIHSTWSRRCLNATSPRSWRQATPTRHSRRHVIDAAA